MSRKKVTVPSLLKQKADGEPIVMVTAYDATFAKLLDATDVDIILVGDSLGMVMQGREHTLEVTVEDVAYHTRCVTRGASRAQVVADMPFMSYQVSAEQALTNAGRLVKEGGAHAVKLEGGERVSEAIGRITAAGIPVMGHLGLTPQSVHAFGGFKVQARERDAAEQLEREALLLQECGCYSLVLEGIPAPLAKRVSASLSIPTIGIGAGVGCDGQVRVIQDLLGMDPSFKPKFVKRFATLAETIGEAVNAYATEVRARTFPGPEHSFGTPTPVPDPAKASGGGGYGPQR